MFRKPVSAGIEIVVVGGADFSMIGALGVLSFVALCVETESSDLLADEP